MSSLDGFRSMDFLEQITLLNDLASGKDASVLPGLKDLFFKPVGDTSIDYMVVTALNSVLSKNEAETVAGLASDHQGFRTLCVRVAGEYAFPSAAPVLARMAADEADQDRLFEILTSLARIGDTESLPIFQTFLVSDEDFIKALCIEMAGRFKDASAVPALMNIVSDNESDARYEVCDLTTWKAVEALADIGSPEALSFLVDNLHHRNPTARRVVTDCLVKIGEPVVPLLEKIFAKDDLDEKILAANVLGFIGHKAGANILVSAYDRGVVAHPNLKYAVYEALGRIGTMKGIICLMDGLKEDDELILMAVVGGLERYVNPGMVKALLGHLSKADAQADLLTKAIVASSALKLFEALFRDEAAGKVLGKALSACRDEEVLGVFRTRLEELGDDAAKAVLSALPKAGAAEGAKKALAADDSRSMVALYRSILTGMGFEPLVGGNGQEAFAFVEQGEDISVVITDMNMPVMDGMELVAKLRATPGYEDVPVIMVTTESESSQRQLASKTGVTAFVTKPFKPDQLAAKIKELVG